MNKKLIQSMLLAASVSAIQRPFKLDGSLIDFDENEVSEPINFKKRYTDDIELLKTSDLETEHAQENMEMGSLNKDLAIGLVEDVKKNMMDVQKHITEDLSVDQAIDQSDDSQGKINMAEFEAKMHAMTEDGEKIQKEQAVERATMIKDMIPKTEELEQKLSMLKEGTYTDPELQKLEKNMDKIIGSYSEKPAKKAAAHKKSKK
jgi:hypothetical protein